MSFCTQIFRRLHESFGSRLYRTLCLFTANDSGFWGSFRTYVCCLWKTLHIIGLKSSYKPAGCWLCNKLQIIFLLINCLREKKKEVISKISFEMSCRWTDHLKVVWTLREEVGILPPQALRLTRLEDQWLRNTMFRQHFRQIWTMETRFILTSLSLGNRNRVILGAGFLNSPLFCRTVEDAAVYFLFLTAS